MKIKGLITLAVTLVSVVYVCFQLEKSSFGALDIYPRTIKTIKCKDGESVSAYRKKSAWGSAETDLWIKVLDKQGETLYEQRLSQWDMWQDAVGQIHGDAPAGFCNDAMRFVKSST